MQCLACGAALPPGPSLQCAHCQATLAVSRLVEAHAAVQPMRAALQAHRDRPAPHVVQARLAAQSTDLPRRRAWAKQMQAEADAQRGAVRDESLADLFDLEWPSWQVAAGAIALALLGWFLFG
jgi:hypothetical protein